MTFEQRAAARELEAEPLALDPTRMGRLFAGGWRVARAIDTRLDRRGAVAVIPVHGVIAPRASWVTQVFGGVPLDRLRDSLRSVGAMPGVTTIVLAIDSPGGSVYAVEETAQVIREVAAKGTRVIAVADGLAASAAYWLGSAADEFVVTPSGEVGSIGVYTMHFDWSGAMADAGVKVTVVRAGEHKAEGHRYEPLGDDTRAHIQSLIDDYYRMFVRSVAKGRGTSGAAVLDRFGQGRTFTAHRAVERGMADRVATLDSVIAEAQKGRAPAGRRRAEASAPAASRHRTVDEDRWTRYFAAADDAERALIRRVAIHESGHAVAFLLDGGLHGLGLKIGDDGKLSGGQAFSKRSPRRTDVCFAAGIAAELEHGFGDQSGRGADLDRREIEEEAYRTGKVVDIPRAISKARHVVAPHYSGIRRLARALEAYGWVDGAEAARLLGIEAA